MTLQQDAHLLFSSFQQIIVFLTNHSLFLKERLYQKRCFPVRGRGERTPLLQDLIFAVSGSLVQIRSGSRIFYIDWNIYFYFSSDLGGSLK